MLDNGGGDLQKPFEAVAGKVGRYWSLFAAEAMEDELACRYLKDSQVMKAGHRYGQGLDHVFSPACFVDARIRALERPGITRGGHIDEGSRPENLPIGAHYVRVLIVDRKTYPAVGHLNHYVGAFVLYGGSNWPSGGAGRDSRARCSVPHKARYRVARGTAA